MSVPRTSVASRVSLGTLRRDLQKLNPDTLAALKLALPWTAFQATRPRNAEEEWFELYVAEALSRA